MPSPAAAKPAPGQQPKTPTKLTRKPGGTPQKLTTLKGPQIPTKPTGSKDADASPAQADRRPSTDRLDDELVALHVKAAHSAVKGDTPLSQAPESIHEVESDEEKPLKQVSQQSEEGLSIYPPEPIYDTDDDPETRVQDLERDASDVEEVDDGDREKLPGQDLSVPNLTFPEKPDIPGSPKSPEFERQSNPSKKFDSSAAPSEGISTSTKTILALYSQAKNRTMALLREFQWQDSLKSKGIAIDDGALRLSFWAHDLQIDREASQLADYEYDEHLFEADEFYLRDVAAQAREVRRLMERVQKPEEWEIAIAVDEYDRAVKSLSRSAAAHRALLDANGEVAALRRRLQAIEDSLMEGGPRAVSEVEQDLDRPSEGADSIIAPEAPASSPPPLPEEADNQYAEDVEAAPTIQKERRPLTVKEVIRLKTQAAILTVIDKVLRDLFQKDHPLLDDLGSLPSITAMHGKIADLDTHTSDIGGKPWEVNERGEVVDGAGNVVGRLVEGDADALWGYPCNDDGEILDGDGDLVGRWEAV